MSPLKQRLPGKRQQEAPGVIRAPGLGAPGKLSDDLPQLPCGRVRILAVGGWFALAVAFGL